MKTAIVVGGNRGIGLECVKLLIEEKDVQKVVATARNPEKFPKIENGEKLQVEKLNITSEESVLSFAEKMGPSSYDILVLNAGVAPEGNDKSFESIKTTIDVNYFGISSALKSLFPLACEEARIVCLSSVFGLRGMLNLNPNPNVFEGNYVFDYGQKLFSTTLAKTTFDELDIIAKRFIEDQKNPSQAQADGWPSPEQTPMTAYDMSKLLVNNLVRLYGEKAASEGKNVLINSACPGFCDTDMTAGVPCEKPKTARDGAESVLSLCFIAPGRSQPNGKMLIDA
ncbi:Oidioi.mRNA.OKI2018_I69.chr2.g4727.t1.cds [Oikopleura dioica]|uniref:Oidioi.mRNA.OKI2018_I69.chr2.g4727.t1.cds n=1 Tax=Oikopleura dioica TaxID=34765 RepID=A0ABN7T1L1_OIKDI|nr:Oidioi.mRNA.OKI2018_I69.chr2.g4727.t1.cds [Oikopleura dioica]